MGASSLAESIEKLADLIVGSRRIVVFTGAGISTESGIPDFRGPQGLWTRLDPEDFTYQKFVGDREARRRIWQLHASMGLRLGAVEPNLAHRAIAEMEKLGKLDCIITQNIDGLHQKAGSSQEKVIELHGTMQWAKCLSCGARYRLAEVERWLQGGVEVPECPRCCGVLKPDAVLFGEAMPARETSEAERRSASCDLFIVIGSSLVVYPAALMPEHALRAGAKLAIINQGETDLDHAAHVRIAARAGEVMPAVMRSVRRKLGARA